MNQQLVAGQLFNALDALDAKVTDLIDVRLAPALDPQNIDLVPVDAVLF